MKKFFISTLSLSLILLSCESDDTADVIVNISNSSNNTTQNTVILSGTYFEDLTLSADVEYLLNGPLIMSEGTQLIIEPGTHIKALSGGSQVYIAIQQGAKINANGTASKPIIFESDAINPKSGDWGGLVLLGKAPINRGTTATSEVGNFSYGGTNTTDNSGILNYVIIKYSGAKINAESEFNGLSLYAVGNQTTISNIEIFEGADDGVEFFGGTVNVSNMALINNEDDSMDWTDGWNGTATTIYIKQKAEHDKGIEGDNLDTDNGANPFSNPTINTITFYGDTSLYPDRDCIHLRRGTKAQFSNVYMHTYPYGFKIEDEQTGLNALAGELFTTTVQMDDVSTPMRTKNITSTITDSNVYTTGTVTPIDISTWSWISL